MPKIVIRHKVGNFDTWIKGHQDRVDIFLKFGSGFQTFQDVDDPNSVVLVADVDDMEGLQATMADPEVMEKRSNYRFDARNRVRLLLPG